MSRGVVLGSDGKPQRSGLQIFVPRGYEDAEVVGRCLVPGCGAVFYAGEEQAWQKHVGECARTNMDKIKESTRRSPVFEDFDPEVSAHLRKVGQRMLEEGRLEVKPHERTGTV